MMDPDVEGRDIKDADVDLGYGDNSRSARGADGRQLPIDPMQNQWEVGWNAMASRGQGGRVAPLAVLI
jgi:hypothetical protein